MFGIALTSIFTPSMPNVPNHYQKPASYHIFTCCSKCDTCSWKNGFKNYFSLLLLTAHLKHLIKGGTLAYLFPLNSAAYGTVYDILDACGDSTPNPYF